MLLLLALWCVLVGQVPRRRRRCPTGTVPVDGVFCIDRWEGSLVEVLPRGRTRPWSPVVTPPPGVRVRAVSRAGVLPQGYISQVQSRAACQAAGKRLCTETEWAHACRGRAPTPWPYGPVQQPGRCNDNGVNPVPRLFGPGNHFHGGPMNDPRLNRMPRTVALTGRHPRCSGSYRSEDMVGNLHEWVDTVSNHRGVFRGGYFSDVRINGEGCSYATRAHGPGYHDYSTGFRCCADPR